MDPEIEQKVVAGKGPTRKTVIAAAEAPPEEAKALLGAREGKRPSIGDALKILLDESDPLRALGKMTRTK